jgi:hypothetical protein
VSGETEGFAMRAGHSRYDQYPLLRAVRQSHSFEGA